MAEPLGVVMFEWWGCCACGNQNNPELTSQYCSSCNHKRCSGCMLIKPMRSPSPETDADVPAENTAPNLESEPRNEAQVDIQTEPLKRPVDEDLNYGYLESGPSEGLFSDQSQSSRMSAISTNMIAAGTAELVQLLLDDYLIASCAKEALRRTAISREKFQHKLHRLLKQWAQELKQESEPEPYEKYVAPLFMNRYSRDLSYLLCTSISSKDGGHSKRRSRDLNGGSDDDSKSDTDSEDDGLGMDYQLPNVERLRQFLVQSQSYQTFRERIFYFVYPDLHQRLKKQMTRLSQLHSLPPGDANLCQNVISETQHALPQTMILTRREMGGWVNACQELIERQTRMKWDWWPLRPCIRTLAPDEWRLVWTCVF